MADGLSKHTLIYAVGNVINRGVSFLLIPLYTAALSQSAYGVLELVDVTMALLAQLLGFSVGSAMVRFYFDTEDESERRRLVATTQLFFAGFLGLVTATLALLSGAIAPVVFGAGDFRPAFHLAMAILFLSGVGEIPISLIKAERKSVFFITLAVAKLVLEVGLKIYLIVALRLGWYGALLGSTIAWSLVVTVLVGWLLRQTGFHFAWPIVKKLALFCAPLIVSGVAGFALHSADRFMLRWCYPGDGEAARAEIGIYGLAYRLGYVINFLILDPFLLIWFPFIFAVRGADEQQRVMARITTYVVAAMTFGSLALAVVAKDLVALMATEGYQAAAGIVPVILLGYVFWGLYELFHTPFFITKRTKSLPLIVGAAAFTNIALNLFWIPRYGALGAAWATVLAFVVLSALAFASAQRLFVVHYEWGRLGFLLALGLGLFVVFDWSRPASLWLRVALALLVVVAYPTVLLLTGFVRREELLSVRQRLATIRARLSPLRKPAAKEHPDASSAAASVGASHDR
jgi:O-antigen/teichoic acid export membrane protein